MTTANSHLVLLLIVGVLSLFAGGRADSSKRKMDGISGNPVYDQPGSPEYLRDRCTACRNLVRVLNEEIAEPVSKPFVGGHQAYMRDHTRKSLGEDFAGSELRALEILEAPLCSATFGSTKTKCERLLEEKEDDIIAYVRSWGKKSGPPTEDDGMCAVCREICAAAPPSEVTTAAEDAAEIKSQAQGPPPEGMRQSRPPSSKPKKESPAAPIRDDPDLGTRSSLAAHIPRFVAELTDPQRDPEAAAAALKSKVGAESAKEDDENFQTDVDAYVYVASRLARHRAKGEDLSALPGYLTSEIQRFTKLATSKNVAEQKRRQLIRQRNVMREFLKEIEGGAGGDAKAPPMDAPAVNADLSSVPHQNAGELKD